MTYREAGASDGLPPSRSEPLQPTSKVPDVSEDEAARRVAQAVERTRVEVRTEYADERERGEDFRSGQLAETLRRFEKERTVYFESVEAEVVGLALSIARKILEREAQVDPTLLGALVRIALERMQSGPSVRIRTTPGEAARWRKMSSEGSSELRWEVVEDLTLGAGDCIVDTELGCANFGFAAQITAVEEAFTHLLARKPGR